MFQMKKAILNLIMKCWPSKFDLRYVEKCENEDVRSGSVAY